jgi:hypothetical protein
MSCTRAALILFVTLVSGIPDAARSQPIGPPPTPPMPAELEIYYRFALPFESGVFRIVGEGKLPLEIPGRGSFAGEGPIGFRLDLPRELAGCTHNYPPSVRYTVTGTRLPAAPVDKLSLTMTSHPPAVPPRISCPDGGAIGMMPYTGGTGNISLEFVDGDSESIVPPEGIPGGMIEGKVTLHLMCAVPASGGAARVEFVPERPSVSEQTSTPKAQVDRLTQSSQQRIPLLGLTRPKPSLPPQTVIAPVFTPAKNGQGWCLEIEIGIEFPNIEMLIPREYAARQCNLAKTREHEMTHYEIYLDLVTIAKGEIRRAVEQAGVPSKARPTYVKSEAEKRAFEEAWVSYIKEGLLPPIYEKFNRDLKAANDLLNTREVHARVTAQCPSW